MDLDGAKINGSVQSSEKKGEAYIKVEQSGVRRKLFQEDGTDGNDAYQDFVAMSICDQGTQMCQRNWNREFKADVKRDNQIFDKERKDITILIISICKDLSFMKMLENQAKLATNNTTMLCEVSHCFPESAHRLTCLRQFTLIFLDLNCDYVENLLKISLSIRSSTLSNSSTPIIAMKHVDPYKDENWKKYGISEIVYGPLYQATVCQIFDKYLIPTLQRDLTVVDDKSNLNLTSHTASRQDEFKVPSVPPQNKFTNECIESAASKNVWPTTRNDSPIQACDSTDQITPYCESDNAGGTVQIQVESCSGYENEKAAATQGTFTSYSVNCIMPLAVTTMARQVPVDSVVNNNGAVTQLEGNGAKSNSSGWNFIQQILDMHQNVQKDMDQKSKQAIPPIENSALAATKTVISQPSATAYPSIAQYPTITKNYTVPSLLPAQALPQNAGYMISGTPEAGNMKLSLIPDEYAKHSTKERERRERIKESCDELRKILPRQLMMGRRQDMASVLEMTVYYLRVVQDHLPTVIQQQLYQTFMTYAEIKQRRKRKATDITQTLPSMVQTKMQRLSNGVTSTSSNGCHVGSYQAASYMPQMMPPSNHQQANTGYFSPLYHTLITNPYHGTVNASPVQTVYGSGSLPSLDHVMHLRSQYFNENQQTHNSIPCYAAATTSSRDTGNSNVPRQDPCKTSFIN